MSLTNGFFARAVRLPQVSGRWAKSRSCDIRTLQRSSRWQGLVTGPPSELFAAMSSGLPYADALRLARKAAPLLDISVSEFMRLRKNE